jgi:hypothetical protein
MQANVRMLRQPGWVGEFRAFVAGGNVVDLAIGIIIGAASSAAWSRMSLTQSLHWSSSALISATFS